MIRWRHVTSKPTARVGKVQDSNYRELQNEYNKVCTKIFEKTSAHTRARKAENKEAIMNDIKSLYVVKDDIKRNQLIPIENK